jgi:hypothetical protein
MATVDIHVLQNDELPAGDKVSIVAVSTPAGGTATILPGSTKERPTIQYTSSSPLAVDSFTYQIADATGAKALGRVVVYGPETGSYKGEILPGPGGYAPGSVALKLGSLGVFSGTIEYNKKALTVSGARLDANGSWEKTFALAGGGSATVSLTLAAGHVINGAVTSAGATNAFVAK